LRMEKKAPVPTAEHFSPLFTALGAADGEEKTSVFNNYCELGSMSMTSYLFG
jgi:4,5-DOPA dioxygenase extradiol